MSNLPSEPEFEQAYKGTFNLFCTLPSSCNLPLTLPHNNRARVNPRKLLPLQEEP